MQRCPQKKFTGWVLGGVGATPPRVPVLGYFLSGLNKIDPSKYYTAKSAKDVWTGIKNPDRTFVHLKKLCKKNLRGLVPTPPPLSLQVLRKTVIIINIS
jgi:hypothetical protein